MAAMPELKEVLERLNLSQYLDVLTTHGFHDWDTVLDITEDDFTSLGFKLGHRRNLQREIATFRGLPRTESLEAPIIPVEPPLLSPSVEGLSLQPRASVALSTFSSVPAAPSVAPREKRRYRRHPRPDPNAPKRPKTAYVNFADELRRAPEIRSLSFVDIAKEVGRQWQTLSPTRKRAWESDAARSMQEYELQMDEYKESESWRKYQAYLSEFKKRQGQTARTKRPSNTRVDSFAPRESSQDSTASTDSPGALLSSTPTTGGPNLEACHNGLTLAFSELVSLRTEILAKGAQPYDENHLPPEALIRRAMLAFVQRTGALLYMWTDSQVEEIIDRIYRPKIQVDSMTLAECFTVAAMGAHYDYQCFPDCVRRVLYASGTLQFNEKSARVDYLRTMRLLLSMSFYAVLEKHMGSRYLIAAGLQIARCRAPPPGHPGHDIWRKLFQSLIFMDSWLSYTLGYTAEVKEEDITIACTRRHHGDPETIAEMIHTEIRQLAIIAAEIPKAIESPDPANITMLGQKLEAWRKALPPHLQFADLMSSNPSEFLNKSQRRSILMVHIMHFGALILLYRHPLAAEAEKRLVNSPTTQIIDFAASSANGPNYIDQCGIAGQHIARIMHMMEFDETLCKTCWLLIYWAFTACAILLFTATLKLLTPNFGAAESDLVYARYCMDILEPCRNAEPVAKRYYDIVAPLYSSLRDLHQRMMGRVKTSLSMLLHADPDQVSPPLVVPVSREEVQMQLDVLAGLIKDPFGRMQVGVPEARGGRRVDNGDGSFTVFWWR